MFLSDKQCKLRWKPSNVSHRRKLVAIFALLLYHVMYSDVALWSWDMYLANEGGEANSRLGKARAGEQRQRENESEWNKINVIEILSPTLHAFIFIFAFLFLNKSKQNDDDTETSVAIWIDLNGCVERDCECGTASRQSHVLNYSL